MMNSSENIQECIPDYELNDQMQMVFNLNIDHPYIPNDEDAAFESNYFGKSSFTLHCANHNKITIY